MNIPVLSINEALGSVVRNPVLVIGPSATSYVTLNSDILSKFKTRWPSFINDQITDHRVAYDFLKTNFPDEIPEARNIIHDMLRNLPVSGQIRSLAAYKWSAVVSITSDILFETALRNECDMVASSLTVTVIDHPSVTPPPHTLPVYKLLGNIDDTRPNHTVALGNADYLRRKSTWHRMLATLPDYVKSAPLLFVGTDTAISDAREFISSLHSAISSHPKRLLFLKGDGTINDVTFLSLASDFGEIAVVDASVKEFCENAATLIKPREVNGYPLSSYDNQDEIPYASLFSDLTHLVDIVPASLPKGFEKESHRKRLVDGLFRPTSLDWLPYICDLPLVRTDSMSLSAEIYRKFEYLHKQANPIILLRGEAGVGKSTVMKQLAIRFARENYLVIWCKRPPHGIQRGSFVEVAKRVAQLQKREAGKLKVLVLCDDPFGLRIQPNNLIDLFEQYNSTAVFVVAARNTDVLAEGSAGSSLPIKPDSSIELKHELDVDEIERLKQFLVNVGVASLEDAAKQVESIPTNNATDILCSLWYLLPETRSQFSASLQDEYCRIGGASGAIKAYAHDVSALGDRARLAYEAVAVTSSLDMGLPLEVLIRTVGLSYEEWAAMCVGGKPAWGLLYDAIDPETDNVVFNTRNHIVTKVLLELVNGGAGHGGEFRVLKELVSACTSSTVPYRSFLVDLLVTRRKKLEKSLSYEWGAELYELAINTFPIPDRTLEHHYGTWHRQMGHKPQEAYKQYEKALSIPSYPYAVREEKKEHVHTSMAAAVVDMVKKGEQRRDNALELVEEHLRHATNASSLDPHTDHVFANLLFQLSRIENADANDQVSLRSVAEALRTIEHSLQFIGANGRQRLNNSEHIRALHELQSNIISTVQIDEARTYSAQVFDASKNQSGFEVVGRCLLQKALQTDKGGDYREAYDYLTDCIRKVVETKNNISVDLLATRIDCFIRWRIQQTRGAIEWETFKNDLETVVADRKYQDDLIKQYYYALSLYHLGDYTKAQAVFELIKRQNLPARVRSGMRNCLVGPEGMPLRIQGEVRAAHGKSYVFIPKLQVELEIYGPVEAAAGATVNVYVVFSIVGPHCTFDRPSEYGSTLP